jgi:hypothetical protein
MAIYRLTFTTDLLVDCDNEERAVNLGYDHLQDEVRNNTSDLMHIQKLESMSQLRRDEKGSLPWRDSSRRDDPEQTVDQILLTIQNS